MTQVKAKVKPKPESKTSKPSTRNKYITALTDGPSSIWYRCERCQKVWVDMPERHAQGCPNRPNIS